MRYHLPSFLSIMYKVCFDAFLCCRELWHMRSHLTNFLSLLYIMFFDAFPLRRWPWAMRSNLSNFIWIIYVCVCVLMLFLRHPEPWEMRSHLPWFVSISHRVGFDAFLRCRLPCKMRSHLSSFLSMLYRMCLYASYAAASIGRWDLILEDESRPSSNISMLCMMCFCAILCRRQPCKMRSLYLIDLYGVFWCIPALPGTLKDEISCSKLYFHVVYGMFWCLPALLGALKGFCAAGGLGRRDLSNLIFMRFII